MIKYNNLKNDVPYASIAIIAPESHKYKTMSQTE